MKTVNEIIEKLGLKNKNTQNTQGPSKESETPEPPKKTMHPSFQSATTPMHKV